jgi:hypothetical protein
MAKHHQADDRDDSSDAGLSTHKHGGKLTKDDDTSDSGSHVVRSPEHDRSTIEMKEMEKLVDQENKEVHKWRLLVALMLLSTAALVTYFTYRVFEEDQKTSYEAGVS